MNCKTYNPVYALPICSHLKVYSRYIRTSLLPLCSPLDMISILASIMTHSPVMSLACVNHIVWLWNRTPHYASVCLPYTTNSMQYEQFYAQHETYTHTATNEHQHSTNTWFVSEGGFWNSCMRAILPVPLNSVHDCRMHPSNKQAYQP